MIGVLAALSASFGASLMLTAGVSVDTWEWWVQPCTATYAAQTGCEKGDPELARLALLAWQNQSAGRLRFLPSESENEARLRIYWAGGNRGLYGEARQIERNGRDGSEIYVLPQTDALGLQIAEAARQDHLLRDSIVFLTCLHESGHALGMPHTAEFDDIMYSFRFGGDLLEYFARYRRKLKSRADIGQTSGISPHDAQLFDAILSRAVAR